MDEYTQLRQLLLQEEQERLNKLDLRLNDPQQRTHETAEVLPQAIHLLTQHSPEPLQKALQSSVENCVESSFKAEPLKFAKPLLNVMSQPLRKAIADSFKSIREFVQVTQDQTDALGERVQVLEQRDWKGLITQLKQQEKRLLNKLHTFEHEMNDIDKRTSELAHILPVAIRKASELQVEQAVSVDTVDKLKVDVEELSASLKGPVERSLRESISDDPHSLANALFPIMGPAIRKSINESIKGLIQNINRTVERSLSAQGMAWRLEALRTGRPFGEIVLQKTLIYRVEQVFLIHRDSGLLIQHLHLETIEVGDSDAVSGMLTAIQDFIRDSFSTSKKEELDSVDIGDFTVWLERGPYAVLACVMRGSAPYAFRGTMRSLLELMHARYGRTLENFDGDSSTLDDCRPLLQKAMRVEEVEPETGKKKSRFSPLLILIVSLLFGIGGWLGYQHWQAHVLGKQVEKYLQALKIEPGIILTDSHYDDQQLYLRGLRDELARDAQTLAQEVDFSALEVQTHWQIYQDMAPAFVEQRLQEQAQRWLRAPDTVEVQWQGRKLILSGHAERNWIHRVQNNAPMLAGLSELDVSQLVENDAYWQQTQGAFEAFLKALNNTPGIIVVSSGVENNQRFINGMRDPLAVSPDTIAEQMQVHKVRMQWRNYQDLTPEFVRQRVAQYLAPLPPTVKLDIQGNVLHLSGHASPRWLEKALRASSVAGINQVDASALQSTDAILLARAQAQLQPPDTVTLSVEEGVLQVSGVAGQRWLEEVLHTAQIEGIEQRQEDELQSQDALLLAQAQSLLKIPDSVQLQVQYRTLIFSGSARLLEIQHMMEAAQTLDGIKAIDASSLQDQDAEQRTRLRDEIDQAQIRFSDNVGLESRQQRALRQLAKKIRTLATLNAGLETPLKVVLTGYTDGLGSLEQNSALSRARANVLKHRLQALGVPQTMLHIQMPDTIRFGERSANLKQRTVSFKVEEVKD